MVPPHVARHPVHDNNHKAHVYNVPAPASALVVFIILVLLIVNRRIGIWHGGNVDVVPPHVVQHTLPGPLPHSAHLTAEPHGEDYC